MSADIRLDADFTDRWGFDFILVTAFDKAERTFCASEEKRGMRGKNPNGRPSLALRGYPEMRQRPASAKR
jgi:hypothetical protein